MKPTITLRPITHRQAEQLGIFFKNNLTLNIKVRKEAGDVWSQTKKCWYIPLDRKAFDKLKAALNEHAILDTGELKKFLEEKKSHSAKNLAIRNISNHRSLQLISYISPVRAKR